MSKHRMAVRAIRDAVAGIGVCSIIIGCYWAWPPLSWMFAGGCLVACAVASYWMEPKDDKREG